MQSNKQKQWMKMIIKYAVVLAVVLVLAVLAEILVFNRTALMHSYDAITFEQDRMQIEITDTLAQLSEDEQNALEVEEENKKLLAEYNGEEYVKETDESLVEQDGKLYRKVKETSIRIELDDMYYIKKFRLELPVEENAGYTLNVYENGQMADNIYCSINPKLNVGIANVGKSTDMMEVVILTTEEPDLSALKITISNAFSLNMVRIGFFVVLFLTLYCIFAMNGGWTELLKQKPQWFFAVFALLFGSLLIMGIGTNQVSYDEYVHAKSAYKLSFGSTIETTEAAMQMGGNMLPYFNNPEERELVETYEDEMNDPDIIAPDIGHQSRFPRTETRVYYPMALGFYLGRVLHTGFAAMVALAKLGNLLCYILIVFWAVKKAKGYGMVVAGIGLLPNNIFIASALSYDALVTSCLLLAYVLLLNEIMTPDEKIKPGNAFLMLIAFVVGCISKPVYIVMALMLLFLPAKKFSNKWMAVIFKLSVIMIACVMIYNIFYPTPVAGSDYQLVGNIAYSGDKRSVGTSTTGQIAYILNNPLTYTKVLLSEMFSMLGGYTVLGKSYVGYAYLGDVSFRFNWILIILGIFAAMFAKAERKIGKGIFWLTHLMNFGVAAIVFSSMYISYTAVGSSQIQGVQGRYFIPLFLPFLSCFLAWGVGKNRGIAAARERLQQKPAVYERIIFAVLAAVNLYMIWTLVILKMNV
jgi:uncharacterized membrane protein